MPHTVETETVASQCITHTKQESLNWANSCLAQIYYMAQTENFNFKFD